MLNPPSIPAELFGYKVVDKVGEGAASTVYAVMDPKSRQVMALKHVLRRTEKDQRFIDQIEQEYKVGSKLDHPNIRAITKFLTNRKFVVGAVLDAALLMELVDATTLDLSPRPSGHRIASYFAQCARALGHMHERGFVHADMKPSNMMVCEDHTVKVIDLGQACAVGTVKKRIQGTPGYIAPEQAQRDAVTAATDVYNLGATMHWVLVGEVIPTALPPKGDGELGAVDVKMIQLPKPPHVRNSRIPAALSELVMDCIQLDPAARVASMKLVSERLSAIADELRQTGVVALQHAERAGK
jgi:serine/threonine-protein kinase